MAKTQIIDVPTSPTQKVATVVKDRREGLALITTLAPEVELLGTVTDAGELAVADELFGRIQKARKVWRLKMYGTKDKPGPIPAIRSGLDQLYELNREVDQPLEKLETAVETAMKGYHLLKLREAQAEAQAKAEREAETQRILDELERKKQALRTPQAQAKVEAQILEVTAELDEIQQEEAPAPVESEHSTGRAKKVPVVLSVSDVCEGVVNGMIPEDVVTVNMVKLRAYYRDDPAAVALFPGIELQDDITIVGR